jgi:outer membrane protein TolC
MRFFRYGLWLILLCGAAATTPAFAADPLPLKQAVQLALRHSSVISASEADEQRAFAALQEGRDQYIPQATIGSGLGKTYGYPLSLEGSAPSIANLNASSALLNPALQQYIHAEKSEYQASQLQGKDKRNQVIQEVVLSYIELARWQSFLDHLQQETSDAAKSEQIENERVKAGVDNAQLQTQTQLNTARVQLRAAQTQGAIDILRHRLSDLTGVPASDITADPDSVPALPRVPEDSVTRALQFNPTIQAAESHSLAEVFRAKAEHRGLWPTIDFAAQYALLASFNNYENYFRAGSFQQHNATVGIAMRFPFLNFSQMAKAREADAEAIRARSEVTTTKSQISEETLRLQHLVEQTIAAQHVADLEYKVAQSNFQAVTIRTNDGSTTIHDLDDARAQFNERFYALQDANFQVQKAKLELMRATDDLAAWAGVGK